MKKAKKNENVRKEGRTAKVETKKGQKGLKEELYPIEPHGGKLVIRHFPKKTEKNYPIINISRREWCDLQLIGIGALSPLSGFMTKKDYHNCVDNMRLSGGTLWSIPITLSVDDESYAKVKKSDVIYLQYEGKIWGEILVEEIYKPNKEKEALKVYGTTSEEHPSVSYLKKSGSRYIGGKVNVFEIDNFGFPNEFFTPLEVRKEFLKRGWRKVVGFQTRNAPHRGHEFIQKCALELVDGLFINPLVGETKSDDVPSDKVVETYRVLIEKYYNKSRVFLGILPSAMRYGGPREAVHHAIIRKNYGCTHFIIGRDHAGYKNFYGPYDAHKIFEKIDQKALGITPLFFDNAFWCNICGEMTTEKACPHPAESRISISGTQARAMLSRGEKPPSEFMRPEVAEILISFYSQKTQS
jgi:sulfate adenylyltransferase